jgi:ParB family chromosome partitioning protein
MKSSLLHIAVEQIACAPQVRTRFDDKKQADLEQSLREVGLLQPILVRPTESGYLVLDGERRLRAARQLKWPTIAAIVIDDQLGMADTIQRQLIANAQRADLTPIETAQAIRQLMHETGWPASQTAERLGMSAAAVTKHLSLLVLSDELRQAVHKGNVAASTAYEIAKTRDPKEREQLAKEALAGRLTRDGAAGRARATRKKPVSPGRGQRGRLPRADISLGGGRSVRVAGPALSAAALVVWLEELLARLRNLPTPPDDLAVLAKSVSSEGT